jgi:hypothetical protein
MLEDMIPYSDFSTKFDPLGLISQKPMWASQNIDSQIINSIVPQSFFGDVFQ